MIGCLVQEGSRRAPSCYGPTTQEQQQSQFRKSADPADVPENELSTPVSTVQHVLPPVADDQQYIAAPTSSASAIAIPQGPAKRAPPDDRMSISKLMAADSFTPVLTKQHQPYVESTQPTLPNHSTVPELPHMEPSCRIATSVSGPTLEDLFNDDDDDIMPESSVTELTPPGNEFEDGDEEEQEQEQEQEEQEEEEEDDAEPIEPDHYYSGTVPVFKPTMEQFQSFPKFIKKIDDYGMKVGIVKVIPPPEWTAALPDVAEKLRSIRIRQPIVQHINGSQGVFSQTNIEKQRSYSLPQWRKVTEESDHQPPARRGERRKGADSKLRLSPRKRQRTMSSVPDSSADWTQSSDTPQKFKRRNGELSAQELAEFENFDYRFNASEFTPERCEELERIYWKTITYNNPMYGADLLGSLFTDATKEWNVARLDNVLNDLGMDLPGVNTAYLYFGMWKSTFSWHVEDMDLYSINYLHFGAPKQWYSISQKDEKRFFNIMRSEWPDEYKKCKEFLRHKTFLVSPKYLADHGIKVNKLVHNQGEFVITFPFGYHSGYNLGYNCAESVNFATERWLQIGARAKKCKCVSDAVDIDVEDLAYRLKMKKRIARRIKREIEEKQNSGVVAAAPSHEGKSGAFSCQTSETPKSNGSPSWGIASEVRNGIAHGSGTPVVQPAIVPNERQRLPAVMSDTGPELLSRQRTQDVSNSSTIGIVDR